jgi:hypothetical protein
VLCHPFFLSAHLKHLFSRTSTIWSSNEFSWASEPARKVLPSIAIYFGHVHIIYVYVCVTLVCVCVNIFIWICMCVCVERRGGQ